MRDGRVCTSSGGETQARQGGGGGGAAAHSRENARAQAQGSKSQKEMKCDERVWMSRCGWQSVGFIVGFMDNCIVQALLRDFALLVSSFVAHRVAWQAHPDQ